MVSLLLRVISALEMKTFPYGVQLTSAQGALVNKTFLRISLLFYLAVVDTWINFNFYFYFASLVNCNSMAMLLTMNSWVHHVLFLFGHFMRLTLQ